MTNKPCGLHAVTSARSVFRSLGLWSAAAWVALATLAAPSAAQVTPPAAAAPAASPPAKPAAIPAVPAPARPAAPPAAIPAAAALPTPAAAPSPGGAAKGEELPPLPPAWTQALRSIVEDPAPPSLVRDQHYIISNESRHDLFKDAAQNRRGVLIGVGSDQNYLMAGWARPELLILFDFDQVVVNLHRVYRAFFLNATTPEDFMSLWEPKNEARAESLLTAEYTDPTRRAAVLRAYRTARYAVPRRFRGVLATYKLHGVSSFLDDPEQYRYLVQLFRGGRVVMVRGDLTVGTCMSSIAAALRSIGASVRLLYLSNAERYFTYNDAFRKSMLALPTDDSSLVLRTRARRDGSYEYIMQEADNFHAWVSRRAISVSFQYTHLREPAQVLPRSHDKDQEKEEILFAIRRLPPGTTPSPAAQPVRSTAVPDAKPDARSDVKLDAKPLGRPQAAPLPPNQI